MMSSIHWSLHASQSHSYQFCMYAFRHCDYIPRIRQIPPSSSTYQPPNRTRHPSLSASASTSPKSTSSPLSWDNMPPSHPHRLLLVRCHRTRLPVLGLRNFLL